MSKKKSSRFKVPADLACKLIMFHDIADQHPAHNLNDKMILTSEHDKDSDFVFGYVVNQSAALRLQKFMQHLDITLAEKFNFAQVMIGTLHNHEPVETNFMTFLTRRDCPVRHPSRENFGKFAAFACETPEEAAEVSNLLNANGGTITIFSQFYIPRSDLATLIRAGKATVRDADPDIVLNRSAYMRQRLAFPDFDPSR